jgi:tyrosine-protein phosphatase SIW14
MFAPVLALGPVLAAQQPAGIPNFHQVNEHIYRGAQPSKRGLQSLASLGVKTVIDLRGGGSRSEAERAIVEAAGMRYVWIPLSDLFAPTDRQVSRVLALLNDESAGPVFIHCRLGADRTGTIIACYRVSHDHWGNREALDEAMANGMSWVEIGMQRYVMGYK